MNLSQLKIVLNQALIPMILIVVVPSTILGFVVARNFDFWLLLQGLFIITTIDFAGNALNNYADWEVDKLNKKRVELHSILKRKHLLFLSLFLFLLSVPFLFTGNIYLKIFILLGYFVAANYSIGLKTKNGVPWNYATIALFYGPFAFFYGFFSASNDFNLFLANLWMPIFLFFIDMGFSVTKDYEDVEGDKIEKKLTFPVVYGKIFSLAYQFSITSLTFIGLTALAVFGGVSAWYLFVTPFYFIALFVLYNIFKTDLIKRFHFFHNLIRLNALFIRFTILAVSLALGFGFLA